MNFAVVQCTRTRPTKSRSCTLCFFFSSRRRHTRLQGDWSSDVCSSDLTVSCTKALSSALALVWAFVHDTVGPRVKSVDPVDSVSFRLTFTAALDPRRPVDTAQVRVFALPDTTPFPVRTLYGAAQYDSIQARARAVADSLRKARDTTAKRDTTGRLRSEEHTSELQSPCNLVCRLLLEKKKQRCILRLALVQ